MSKIHLVFVYRSLRSMELSAAAWWYYFWGFVTLCFQRSRKGSKCAAVLSLEVHQSSVHRKKLLFLDRFSVIFTGPPAPDELLSFWKREECHHHKMQKIASLPFLISLPTSSACQAITRAEIWCNLSSSVNHLVKKPPNIYITQISIISWRRAYIIKHGSHYCILEQHISFRLPKVNVHAK